MAGKTEGTNMNKSPALPATDAYVELQLLDGGSFMATESKMHAGQEDNPFRLYDWAFFIKDVHSDRHVLWDFGMSGEKSDYPPFIQKYLWDEIQPSSPTRSISQQVFERNGLKAEELQSIIFSHAHWDHCRPFSADFTNASAYFGPGTFDYCQPGHLKNENLQWDGHFFDPDNATEKCSELKGPWVQFGPFPKAMDYFGNGSFWVIQAPGHLAGNLVAAVRLRSGDWVVLAGDCCHSIQLYKGLYEFAVFPVPGGGTACLQEDIPAAKDTLARMRTFEQHYGGHICLAHDSSWMLEGKDEVLMSLLDTHLKNAIKGAISRGARP